MKRKRGSAFLPIRRSTRSSTSARVVPSGRVSSPSSPSVARPIAAMASGSVTRRRIRFLGSMVVSLSCFAGISPRPLNRLISTLFLPLNIVCMSSSLWSSSRAYALKLPLTRR